MGHAAQLNTLIPLPLSWSKLDEEPVALARSPLFPERHAAAELLRPPSSPANEPANTHQSSPCPCGCPAAKAPPNLPLVLRPCSASQLSSCADEHHHRDYRSPWPSQSDSNTPKRPEKQRGWNHRGAVPLNELRGRNAKP